jgi:hypothetical protein
LLIGSAVAKAGRIMDLQLQRRPDAKDCGAIEIERWLTRRAGTTRRLTVDEIDQLARLLSGTDVGDHDSPSFLRMTDSSGVIILEADNKALQWELQLEFAGS